RLAHRALSTWFKVTNPKIAVAALNPHAGEEGMFGREEAEIVLPAVQSAKKEGIDASGPFPADTLFRRLSEGEFDVAVALYHDQALIPIKLLAFGRGVNVTVGIPIIRTSVDHGTAYDIAGKGEADPGSLIEAIRVAVRMARATGKPVLKSGRKKE
ncbi:MAG TPA: 4-hydroxythreonine-4-phosphate dehydrogenase PdxA, partial [Nitrospiria bacterium]|nr:4-hydroxythreonine-4-phosphate dehydrogenase PdxA [Nitrospiria bacterium]